MKAQRITRRRQAGQMSIEYAIIIGIVAIVLAGIIYFVNQARQRSQVNTAVSNVTDMVQSAQKLYRRSSSGYQDVTMTDLIANGVIPDSLVSGADAATTAFGTPMTVSAATLSGQGAGSGLAVTYPVPTKQCSTFVQGVANTFAVVTVAGTTIRDITAQGGQAGFDVSSLGTACQDSSTVDVVMTASR